MSMLDGYIRDVFGATFGPIYLDGVLHKATLTANGKGGWASSYAPFPIKVQIDAVDDAMRAAPGYTASDVKLIVLQAGMVVAPTTDDKITAKGKWWGVASVREDAAASHWVMRGATTNAVA